MGILGYNDDMLRYDKENRGMNLLLIGNLIKSSANQFFMHFLTNHSYTFHTC